MPRSDITAAYQSVTESFLAVSRVHLGSVQRLSALSLDVMRQTGDDLATTANLLTAFETVLQAESLQTVLSQPILERPASYSCSTFEIAAETQCEIAQVMLRYFAQPTMVSAVQDCWSTLGLLTVGLRPITALDVEGLEAVAAEGA
jgi:phasin family protein